MQAQLQGIKHLWPLCTYVHTYKHVHLYIPHTYTHTKKLRDAETESGTKRQNNIKRSQKNRNQWKEDGTRHRHGETETEPERGSDNRPELKGKCQGSDEDTQAQVVRNRQERQWSESDTAKWRLGFAFKGQG